jgi:uncharacterized protein (DUF1697 family)
LRKLCEKAGFSAVQTYIQSGNVVFSTRLSAPKAQAALERALAAKVGKPVGVVLRTRAELDALLEDNPFADSPPNYAYVMFLNEAPARGVVAKIETPAGERLEQHGCEVYVCYPKGMGQSKLKLPFAKLGTARNLNTVRKLASMAAEIEDS